MHRILARTLHDGSLRTTGSSGPHEAYVIVRAYGIEPSRWHGVHSCDDHVLLIASDARVDRAAAHSPLSQKHS